MPQFLRPDEDIANVSGWDTAPLFEKINEETPNTDLGDAVSTNGPANGLYFEVGLTSGNNPVSQTDHIIRFRAVSTDPTDTMKVGLYQGTTLIAETDTETIASASTTFTYTLSEAEAGSITNYKDLRLRPEIVNTTSALVVFVLWAEMEIPDAIHGVEPSHITIDAGEPLRRYPKNRPSTHLDLTLDIPLKGKSTSSYMSEIKLNGVVQQTEQNNISVSGVSTSNFVQGFHVEGNATQPLTYVMRVEGLKSFETIKQNLRIQLSRLGTLSNTLRKVS